MTTTKKLAELKQLAGQARANIFARIKLAIEILADSDWVARIHGGDEVKARDSLQSEYFHELNGTYTLGVLISIYEAFPDEKVWKANRHNLQTMRALWEESRQKDKDGQPKRRTVKLAEYEDLERKFGHVNSRADSLAEENGKLRQQVADLQRENAVLHGRLQELESLLDRQGAGHT